MNPIARLNVALLAASLTTLVVAQSEPSKTPGAKAALERAQELLKNGDATGAKAAVKLAIEAGPDDLEAHDLFLRAARGTGQPTPEQTAELGRQLEAQYEEWQQRFPRSAGVAYGMGAFYSSHEDPRAKPFLARAVELDPKLARVWQMLSIDAERWGDNAAARDCMRKAMEADPQSPDYAFYWASSWQGVDDAKWQAASLDVARRFPTSDRGAQALYWLGVRTPDDAQKIRFWEQSRADFPPEKFSWSRYSMGELFEAYLRTDPGKAVALASSMPQQDEGGGREEDWPSRLLLAQRLVEVKKLVAAGDFAAASKPAAELTVGRHSSSAEYLDLLKAEVQAGAGEVQAAYDALCKRLAATPGDRTRAALLGYGEKLGKRPGEVAADVWALRDKTARPAPEFDLQRYDSTATVSLRSLRGKVVFVTFWFPGCGPCRGEFPHFEHVVMKFAGNQDLVYLGINGVAEQDGYVASFLRATGYSFTPLRAGDAVTRPEAYNVRGYPDNFLIDRDGRIVYAHFRTNGDNELVLQRMIESLLDRPQRGAEGKKQ